MDTVNAYLDPIVIIGASHAGLAVATELRNAGHEGDITLIGAEESLPYHRPHLSKESLAAEMPGPKPIRPDTFYQERRLQVRLGTWATAIDRSNRSVTLADGSRLAYGALILATGASARRLPATVVGAERALVLRDVRDWHALSNAMRTWTSMAVIGGGFIGLEVAAAAREKGMSVTVVEAAPRLMMRSVYPEIASCVLEQHRRDGIDIRLGATVRAVTPAGLELADGEIIDADVVLASIGSQPRIGLADAAGLACSNGVDTDAHGRTTDPAIFALGDCANWQAQGAAMRHESIAAIQFQAKAVAAAITGQPAPQLTPFRLWSFQGKVRLQMSGPVQRDARTQLESAQGQGLLLHAFQGTELIAVQAVNAPRPFIAAVADLELERTERVGA